MVSCPTGALTFTRPVHDPRPENTVDADTVWADPLFKGIPKNVLSRNEGAVIAREYEKGQELCKQGEFGSNAFIIREGEVEILQTFSSQETGLFGPLLRRLGLGKDQTAFLGTRSRNDYIVGEMSVLNGEPRSATIVASTGGCQVWEVRGNLVRLLMRNQVSRSFLANLYAVRAMQTLGQEARGIRTIRGCQRHRWIFGALDADQRRTCIDFLKDKMTVVQAAAGQVVLQQGDLAYDVKKQSVTDGFYILRAGFLRVSQDLGGRHELFDHLTPGGHIGEIGLLSALVDDFYKLLPASGPRGQRTSTCTALDRVELVRIPGSVVEEMIKQHPDLRDAFVRAAESRIDRNKKFHEGLKRRREQSKAGPRQDYLSQGLYQGQSLLMIDLDRCTRCDECTRACVESHSDGLAEGVTRLRRHGPLLGNLLVVTSCRSCHQAHCLDECPVDAIHRRGQSPEIVIENHCIGCGLCAINCPYDNIVMHDSLAQQRRIATTCDQCGGVDGPGPRCVSACPHEAAFRCSGEELLARTGLGFDRGDR
jgi:CRP-like cAMP-binding protein